MLTKTATKAKLDGVDVNELEFLSGPCVARMTIPQTMGGGFFTGMQGWPHDDVHYLWLYQTPDVPQALRESRETPVLFDPRQIIGSRSNAIDSVFSIKVKGPGARGLVAAVMFVVRNSIYIDKMSVLKSWRRRGINSAMIRTIAHSYMGKPMVFSKATHDGKAFIAATGYGHEGPID